MDRSIRRTRYLLAWALAGVFVSLTPLLLSLESTWEIVVIAGIFGVFFGLGMPSIMGFFSSSTRVEKRARLGGLAFMIIGVGWFILESITGGSIFLYSIVLAAVLLVGVLSLILVKPMENQVQETRKTTYVSIITNKPFILYFLPWLMFSLVNFMTFPFQGKIAPELQDLLSLSLMVEDILIAVFAILGGFLADIFGRRRFTILGFAMLGIGYASLGLFPDQAISIIVYTFTDGVAWGIFNVMFLFTLWGDIAQDRKSEKFYVLGALPYVLSNFMRFWLQPYILTIQETAIFSFASVFLFLGVLPLFYAPETLPEKVMKDRDLKSYVQKAVEKAQKEDHKASKKKSSEADEKPTEKTESKESPDDEEAQKLAEKYY